MIHMNWNGYFSKVNEKTLNFRINKVVADPVFLWHGKVGLNWVFGRRHQTIFDDLLWNANINVRLSKVYIHVGKLDACRNKCHCGALRSGDWLSLALLFENLSVNTLRVCLQRASALKLALMLRRNTLIFNCNIHTKCQH